METSIPLNDWKAKKSKVVINRLHSLTHGAAVAALFYYRITSFNANSPQILPHILIFIAEIVLSFLWLLCQASNWNPVARTVYPDNLPGDEHLPSIDIFVCTADPSAEPSLTVMNTVISALALDYPPNKLHLYLSDDGGSPVTLQALKLAWGFAEVWVPFCRKYRVKNRCPEAYFFREEDIHDEGEVGDQFFAEKKDIERAYEDFKICLDKIVSEADVRASRDHPPNIEVITDSDNQETPLVIYVAREKRLSHPHNFKAGALNVLLRLSAMISNSSYILTLDCDMYCNDPTSARQAMCFHLDPKLSPKLAFVQFPQRFYNTNHINDIYDGTLRFIWRKWEGLNGIRGPILSGTGFFMKRKALYGTKKLQQESDIDQLKKYYGLSNEFIKSINRNYKQHYPNDRMLTTNDALQKELHFLASCSYDDGTKWGREVGFRYFAVVEDVFTGFNLHCQGWISVYFDPSRPCFLGASPTNLSDVLVQHTRWFMGFTQISLSKFSPIVYGSMRMSIVQSIIYAEISFHAFYFLPIYILAIVPQLCILRDISLYPEVSSPFFLVFVFLFLSSQLKHMQEVLIDGHSMRTWFSEQRIWMIKSFTSYFFAILNTIMEKIGLINASFVPTNKVENDEGAELYEMGKYNFQAQTPFMVPLCTIYTLNLASFVVGFRRILLNGKRNEMLMQAFIPLFGIVLHFPLLEGMVLRKDKGRVSTSITFVSFVICSIGLTYTALC